MYNILFIQTTIELKDSSLCNLLVPNIVWVWLIIWLTHPKSPIQVSRTNPSISTISAEHGAAGWSGQCMLPCPVEQRPQYPKNKMTQYASVQYPDTDILPTLVISNNQMSHVQIYHNDLRHNVTNNLKFKKSF